MERHVGRRREGVGRLGIGRSETKDELHRRSEEASEKQPSEKVGPRGKQCQLCQNREDGSLKSVLPHQASANRPAFHVS